MAKGGFDPAVHTRGAGGAQEEQLQKWSKTFPLLLSWTSKWFKKTCENIIFLKITSHSSPSLKNEVEAQQSLLKPLKIAHTHKYHLNMPHFFHQDLQMILLEIGP